MVITKTTSKSQKNSRAKAQKKDSLSGVVSDVVVEKKASNNSDTNVSVFTKTTNPNIVINSENVTDCIKQNIHKHKILKSVCLIVMGIIVLMTFFLSLKTYNTVNELYQLFNY
jgi:hypothetical protein